MRVGGLINLKKQGLVQKAAEIKSAYDRSPRLRLTALAAVIAVAFLCQFALNYFTPVSGDDYTYSFAWDTGERLTSLSQIPGSLAYHIDNINGRTLDHLFVHLSMILPPVVFDAVNTAVFVLLCFLIVYHSVGSVGKITASGMALGLLGVFLLIPAYGSCFLWQTGSCNYLWSLCLILAAMAPVTKSVFSRDGGGKGLSSLLCVLPMAALGFLAGATNENTGAAFIFMLVLTLVYDKVANGKVRAGLIAQLAGAVPGFVSILVSPGQLKRLASEDPFSVKTFIVNVFEVVSDTVLTAYPLIIIAAAALIVYFIGSKGGEKKRTFLTAAPSLIWAAGSAAAFFSMVVVSWQPSRTLTGPVVFLMICVGRAAMLCDRERPAYRGMKLTVTALTLVYFFASFPLAVSDIRQQRAAFNERATIAEQQIQHGRSDLILPPICGYTKFTHVGNTGDLGYDSSKWPNTAIARYYGADSVIREGSAEAYRSRSEPSND